MKLFFVLSFAIGIVLALVPHVVYIILKLVSLMAHIRVNYRPFGLAALIITTLWCSLCIYGNIFGRFRYEVKEWKYSNVDIPKAFNNYRIVHLSDIHSGGWIGNEEKLKEIVDSVNKLNPDLICFTGDLVDLNPREAIAIVPVLRELKAKDGIVSVMGNHDYMPYSRIKSARERDAFIEKVMEIEKKELGWHLLLNENIIIRKNGDSICVIGTENQSLGAHPVVQRAKLKKALKGTDGIFRILLTHDPTHWKGEVVEKTDIPLTLCGHTHAMQLKVFGWTPSSWIFKECDGRYDEGHQTVYVNIGLGGSMQMRIGANPEITLTILNRGCDTN